MKRILFNALVLLLSTVFALAGGEVVVRVFAPQRLGIWDSTRDGLTTHVPNITQYLVGFDQTISTNSFGMRDREHEIDKARDVYRILLLGDSFMEAVQVPFEESFPDLLKEMLSKSTSRKIEVINASVSGWGTDDELTYLIRYGRAFRPDLVLIAMTLHNDVSDNLVEEFHTFAGGELHEKPRQDIPFPDYAMLQVKAYLASHSHMAQLFHKFRRMEHVDIAASSLRSHVADLLLQPLGGEVKTGWLMTLQLLNKTNSVAEGISAKMAVFLLPLAIQTSDERLAQFLLAQGLTLDRVNAHQPQQILKQWGESSGVPVIDLLPEFRAWIRERGDTLFVENDGHWTGDGHRIAAKAVSIRVEQDYFAARTVPGVSDVVAGNERRKS